MIHVILWCRKSCDSNKNKSDKWNALFIWNPKTHCCENTVLCFLQNCAVVSSCSQSLSYSNIRLSYKSNLVASWMHLHNCRCFQEHLRMYIQSLRAHCLVPGGRGSIWNHLGAPVRSTRGSGRFVCGFWTDWHFAEVWSQLLIALGFIFILLNTA